jgi:predicted phosphodiesterase
VLEVNGVAFLYVLHNIADLDPAAAGFHAVVSGHSHQPRIRWKDGVLYVNPGSAGPRCFSLPISIARRLVDDGKVSVDLIEIEPKNSIAPPIDAEGYPKRTVGSDYPVPHVAPAVAYA